MFRQRRIESNSPARACAIPRKIANPITIALRTDRINRHSLLRRRNPQQPLVSESKWRPSRIKSEREPYGYWLQQLRDEVPRRSHGAAAKFVTSPGKTSAVHGISER